MRNVVVVGCGGGVAALYRVARNWGLRPIGLGASCKNTESPHHHVTWSTHSGDVEFVARLLRERFGRVDALWSRTSGPAIVAHADLASTLGIRGPADFFARACYDLTGLRELARAIGVQVLPMVTIKNLREIEAREHEIDWPVVLKPHASKQGKVHVQLCESLRDAGRALPEVLANSHDSLAVVEPYSPGQEYAFFSIWSGSKEIKSCVLADTAHLGTDGVTTSGYVAARSPKSVVEMLDQVRDYLSRAGAFGTHAFTLRLQPQGPILTEVGYGAGGDNVLESGLLGSDPQSWLDAELAVTLGLDDVGANSNG